MRGVWRNMARRTKPMTKHQKERLAAKSRARELGKKVLTIDDIGKAKADLQKQAAEENARLDGIRAELKEQADNLEETFRQWTTEYNETVCPALSMQMLLAVLSVSKKYMAKNVMDRYFYEVSAAMQDGIDKVGEGETNWTKLAIELEEKYGYEVPMWARSNFEKLDKRNEDERREREDCNRTA